LAELPALTIADRNHDVRGWQIRSDAGQVLGVVSDLLADPDRLLAEFLLVSRVNGDAGEAAVPVGALEARQSYLVLGSGLRPIELRYVSTTHLSLKAALIAGLLVAAVWSLRVFAC
jgi:hypothetical protein